MNYIERLNTLPATAQEKAWLEERLATLSEKEALVLGAAMLRSPPKSAADAINHLLRLGDYEVCCPAGSYEELGRFYLRSETTIPESLYPFTDLNRLGRNYEDAHPGLFVDNAYVCYPIEEPDFHYNGANLASCVDNDWSVKLKLASRHVPDGVWLRLPDYDELNDGKPDEIRIALDALGVEHIDECTLLEAKCILPEIGDLTQQYDRISDLVYDGQNLGFVLDERGQGMRNFLELYAAALEYEDCSRLSAALDIAEDLNRYDLVPMSGLREYAEKDLKSQGISIPELAQSTFGFEEYAVELLEERGFSLSRNESGYICKKQSQRFSEMSME